MIYLITAVPGGGKTLRAVWYAEKFIAEGRAVFGNITGYSCQQPIPGMSPLVKNSDGTWSGGTGGDWRETPDGSVVIYDEAQRDFPQRSKNSSVPEIIRAMETHRHTAHDIFIITQHPSYLDYWLRRLVGRHEHLRRLGTMGRVALISADSVMELPSGIDSSSGEKNLWKYPASLYKSYESATYHTVKHRIPQPVIFTGIVFLLLIALLIWSYFHYTSSDSSIIDDKPAAASAAGLHSEPSLPFSRLLSLQPVHLRPIQPLDEYIQQLKSSVSLLGCARSVSNCKCWDSKGDPLLISARICSALLDSGFPYSIKIARNNRTD